MAHRFHFFRAGGFDQVRFVTGQDLVHLDELDFKLWVALACPTRGLAFDKRTLDLLDVEKDGRIRAQELISAVKWAAARLKDPQEFVRAPKELPLDAINDATDDGKKLVATAKLVLKDLGKADGKSISVDDTDKAGKAFSGLPFNGDGVVPPESTADAAQKQLITDILNTVGGVDDASGKKGVKAETVKAFFAEVDQYLAWLHKGETDAALMPLKDATVPAFDAKAVLNAKVDDYFARCRLAAFDARAMAALNREEKEYLALAAKDLTITAEEIKAFPLARVEANRPLPLKDALNPGWAGAVAAFLDKTVTPFLGAQDALTEAQWQDLGNRLAPYDAWKAGKPTVTVEKLGLDRLRALEKPEARTLLDGLFQREKEQETYASGVENLERLVRFTRDLFQLANNFVSFRDFYERARKAIFQVGTLWIDQRECDLVLRVDDLPKHMTMAPLSRAYLLYCDLTRPSTGEKMQVVAAMTNGGSDNLMAGRNGLFRDRDGHDWDATITKIVDNPISIGQAFWSPYKKAIRFVEDQVAKRAAEGEAKGSALLTDGVGHAEKAASGAKPAPAPAGPKKLDIGVVAALGVAVGGITAALGALLQSFFGLGVWMPVGLVGLLLLISGPSMLIAWLKLRERNIGPLLDANGWAVNAHAMLNVPFGKSLTKKGRLPPGSDLDRRDPYQASTVWWWLAPVLVVLCSLGIAWYFGKLDALLPEGAQSVKVLGADAPAAKDAAQTPDAGA